MNCCPYQETRMEILPIKDWPTAWQAMMQSVRPNFKPIGWLCVSALVSICLSRIRPVPRFQATTIARATPLLAAGLLNSLFMCSLTWVALNRGTPILAYALLPIVFAQTALLILAIMPLTAKLSLRNRHRLSNACVAFLFVGVLTAFGTPSLRGVHEDLDRSLGKWTPEILDSQATHVCGDYWQVWASVFHANLVLHERGERKIIWGVSYRAAPTKDLWTAIPERQRRLAVLLPEKEPATTFISLSQVIASRAASHRNGEKISRFIALRPCSANSVPAFIISKANLRPICVGRKGKAGSRSPILPIGPKQSS